MLTWALNHVKDPERFLDEMNRPPAGVGRRVSERDLEADAQSFAAFAGAFGVLPSAVTSRDQG